MYIGYIKALKTHKLKLEKILDLIEVACLIDFENVKVYYSYAKLTNGAFFSKNF